MNTVHTGYIGKFLGVEKRYEMKIVCETRANATLHSCLFLITQYEASSLLDLINIRSAKIAAFSKILMFAYSFPFAHVIHYLQRKNNTNNIMSKI